MSASYTTRAFFSNQPEAGLLRGHKRRRMFEFILFLMLSFAGIAIAIAAFGL